LKHIAVAVREISQWGGAEWRGTRDQETSFTAPAQPIGDCQPTLNTSYWSDYLRPIPSCCYSNKVAVMINSYYGCCKRFCIFLVLKWSI